MLIAAANKAPRKGLREKDQQKRKAAVLQQKKHLTQGGRNLAKQFLELINCRRSSRSELQTSHAKRRLHLRNQTISGHPNLCPRSALFSRVRILTLSRACVAICGIHENGKAAQNLIRCSKTRSKLRSGIGKTARAILPP
jgi:hypothetical protein